MPQDRAVPYLHHPQEMLDPDTFNNEIVLTRFISTSNQFVATGVYMLDKTPEVGENVLIEPEMFARGLILEIVSVNIKHERVAEGLEGNDIYVADLKLVGFAD